MQDRSYWRLIRDPGFSWMLASQFLGAFNVNVYTWAITFYALDLASRPDAPFEGATMVGIIGATFIIPYLLFSDHAGQLADRFSKRSVLVTNKSSPTSCVFDPNACESIFQPSQSSSEQPSSMEQIG